MSTPVLYLNRNWENLMSNYSALLDLDNNGISRMLDFAAIEELKNADSQPRVKDDRSEAQQNRKNLVESFLIAV